MRIFALSLPLAAINNILVCLYQANRNTAAANTLTLGRSLVWVVLFAFALSPRMGAGGVWHSFWIAEALALAGAVVTSAFYRRKNPYRSRLLLLDTEAEARGTYKSFSVGNSAESIAESAAGISDFCEENALSPKQTMAISLAIEEMLVMIRAHCFEKDGGGAMNVRVLICENATVLRIRSGGRAFNPIAYCERQAPIGPEPETLSESFGIGMVLKLAKAADYRNTFGVNNVTITL